MVSAGAGGEPVVVRHALGNYPIYVEPGALGHLGDVVRRHVPRRRLALVTDQNVHPLFETWREGRESRWSDGAAPALQAFDAELVVPAGEASKTRERWAELSDSLLERRFGRDTAIVALGGGVIGDLAGFVAATFLRGVPYVQAPTTLLAMLDASVGGKTGVDTAHGKNLIGAFHPPAAVVADLRVLLSLPEREFRSGLAEAVKHGLIADGAYFEWIDASAERILARDLDALTRLVRRSVEIKAKVVSEDEREGGVRAVLNAGHTIGHAVEHVSRFALAHGEAVALGLVAECRLAEALGLAESGLGQRAARLLERLGLPVTLGTPLPAADLLAAMSLDKKNRAAATRFSLPVRVGAMHPGDQWTVAAPEPAILAALRAIGASAGT